MPADDSTSVNLPSKALTMTGGACLLKTLYPPDKVGEMSVRQSIWVLYPVDIERYIDALKTEYGARENPEQPGSYLVGDPPLPFYAPQLINEHMAVTGFNRRPLPAELIDVLLKHPELTPDTTVIRWTEEQELIGEWTPEHLRHEHFGNGRQERL